MISIENLSVEFGTKPLFSNINYVINRNDHIALTGKNGAGKSTMLKIIAGLQSPTSGQVSKPKEISIGYLPQVMKISDTATVWEETEKAFSNILELEEKINKVSASLAERTDYESTAYQELIERLSDLNEQSAMVNASNRDAEIEKTLIGLGFQRSDFNRLSAEFSGGWRMRIELAKTLLSHPDILLLDEPTNHLDIESIQWLERFLNSRKTTIVLISHDKAFLDNVTTRTIEISCGSIYDYNVNYSKYVNLHQERIQQQIRAYENQQKTIADTQAFIDRFRYQASKAIQVQSRIKMLEKIVPIEIDEVDNSRLNIKFSSAPRSGDYPIICEDVTKSYGTHLVFKDVDLTIKRGEKVAFVGRNGEGKSTLVKCIMGETPFEGNLKIGHGVKIGYFAQNQAQLLEDNYSVFDTIDKVAVGDIRTQIRDILGAFMFKGEDIDKKVKVLSGGERSRLAMIKLLLEPVNLLILDEPTNHLDIASKEVLKQAINSFDGTAIIVSHDRDFLDGLVSQIYEFTQGKVKQHIGGIYEFLEEKRLTELHNLNSNPAKTNIKNTNKENSSFISTTEKKNGELNYEQQKELRRQIGKKQKEVSQAENQISQIEEEITDLEKQMASSNGCADVSIFRRHSELKKSLEEITDRWLLLSEELDELHSNNNE